MAPLNVLTLLFCPGRHWDSTELRSYPGPSKGEAPFPALRLGRDVCELSLRKPDLPGFVWQQPGFLPEAPGESVLHPGCRLECSSRQGQRERGICSPCLCRCASPACLQLPEHHRALQNESDHESDTLKPWLALLLGGTEGQQRCYLRIRC